MEQELYLTQPLMKNSLKYWRNGFSDLLSRKEYKNYKNKSLDIVKKISDFIDGDYEKDLYLLYISNKVSSFTKDLLSSYIEIPHLAVFEDAAFWLSYCNKMGKDPMLVVK